MLSLNQEPELQLISTIKGKLAQAYQHKDFISVKSSFFEEPITGKITAMHQQSFNFDSIYGQEYELQIDEISYFLNMNACEPSIELKI